MPRGAVTSDKPLHKRALFYAVSAPALWWLGALKPRTLAIMHGPLFRGDCAGQLESLAQEYENRLAK